MELIVAKQNLGEASVHEPLGIYSDSRFEAVTPNMETTGLIN